MRARYKADVIAVVTTMIAFQIGACAVLYADLLKSVVFSASTRNIGNYNPVATADTDAELRE